MPVAVAERLRIARVRLAEHWLNSAEAILLSVLAETPDDPEAQQLLGVARCKLGRSAEGLDALRRATSAAPEVESAWCDLAVALRDAGDASAAEQARTRAADLYARRPQPARLLPLPELAFSTERARYHATQFDYPFVAEIRHGAGRPPYPELAAKLAAGRAAYGSFLAELGGLQADFAAVPMGGDGTESGPYWLNGWFPPLDGMALTGMLRRLRPGRFVEIGSGMSTKWARRAVQLYGLGTKLVSIDPEPRSEIDTLCDRVIRSPLERCDPAMFETLQPDDILFLDSSHRAFQGSDVTVFFMEILPRLRPGVVVHLHDIYLPEDYISGHVARLWNEQYLLAAALLFGDGFEVMFPSWYVGRDPELKRLGQDRLCLGPMRGLDLYGASFWMRRTPA